MSETKELSLVPFADFTSKDIQAIQKFKDDGLLGLHELEESQVQRMMDLYLGGKTYSQIAQIINKKKSVILYLANRFKWYELRKDYLEELMATLPQKIIESKLQSQEFLMTVVQAYQKKINKNLNKYLATDNEEFYDKISKNDLTVLMKIMESLHRLNSENLNPNDKALVGLNGLGEGMTITKTGANSVEITPKSLSSSKLKQFADMKREQERASQVSPKESHDISIETVTENELGNVCGRKEKEEKNES